MLGAKAKLLELRVFFVFSVRVYLQLVVIVYSFPLLYCLLSFWCHHRCVMLRNLSSFWYKLSLVGQCFLQFLLVKNSSFLLTLSQETVKVNFSHTPFVHFSVFFDVFVILY